MAAHDPLTASLPPELRRSIQAQVVFGRHQAAVAVVRAGLRLPTRADPPASLDPARVPDQDGTGGGEPPRP